MGASTTYTLFQVNQSWIFTPISCSGGIRGSPWITSSGPECSRGFLHVHSNVLGCSFLNLGMPVQSRSSLCQNPPPADLDGCRLRLSVVLLPADDQFSVPVFFLWTSSRWSSLGNVSFIGRSFLIPFETRGMSGLGVDLGWSVLCSDSENTKAEILKLCCLLLICRRARKSDVSRSGRSQTSGYFV